MRNGGTISATLEHTKETADTTNVRMLLVPSGEVLMAYPGEFLVRPAVTSGWDASWQPHVNSISTTILFQGTANQLLSGYRLHGLSEACN